MRDAILILIAGLVIYQASEFWRIFLLLAVIVGIFAMLLALSAIACVLLVCLLTGLEQLSRLCIRTKKV